MRGIKIHQILIAVLLQVLIVNSSYSQTTGYILLISNIEAQVLIDSEEIGQIEADKPGKFKIAEGDHYLQFIPIDGREEKNEVLTIETGKQKVIKFEFEKCISEEFESSKIIVRILSDIFNGLVIPEG